MAVGCVKKKYKKDQKKKEKKKQGRQKQNKDFIFFVFQIKYHL